MVALERKRGVIAELLVHIAQAEVLVLIVRQLLQVVRAQLARLRAQQRLQRSATCTLQHQVFSTSFSGRRLVDGA